jgi:hypothetical protein
MNHRQVFFRFYWLLFLTSAADAESSSFCTRPKRRSELLGHDTVDYKAEAGVDADEKLWAVVCHEEPEGQQTAVVFQAEAVVSPRQTFLNVQDESEKKYVGVKLIFVRLTKSIRT